MGGAFFPAQKVLVEKGKIAVIASKVLKNVDVVIDAESKYLIPGLIDAHTHLGLVDHGYGISGSDLTESFSAITPQLRPLDGIKMRHQSLDDARKAGVTTCMVCPGTMGVIAGQCSILKTNGNSADVGLIFEQAGIAMNFGEEPKHNFRNQKKAPSTRMGAIALIRETLMKAQDYRELKHSKKGIKDRIVEYESLCPLLEGQVPLRANAHRIDDIMSAIRIAEEFNLRLIIEHGTEAHLAAPILAKKAVPVVLGPTLIPEIRTELREQTFESAAILMDAGVKVALTTDYPGLPIETLRIAAAMAVQYGLDEKRALQSITETAAEILGISHRAGIIKKGYDADLALFSGHPLDIRSKLEYLVIDGEIFRF